MAISRTAMLMFAVSLLLIAIAIANITHSAEPAAPAKDAATATHAPLKLHPDNPHYLLFRGKPTILIGSTEHYGSVLNRDFEYVRYLDTLQAQGMNLTRTFSGTYWEVPSSFGIVENTLAPTAKRVLCPWPRSATSGALDGENKFDLAKWDDAYFERLHDFVMQAGKRGVVVECVLFCAIYDDKLWSISPMNPANNTAGIGGSKREAVFNLDNKELLAVQDALVKKIVITLHDCDNVYYEICNEPYFGSVTPQWNDHIATTISDTEKAFPARHLIAQNISNGSAKVNDPQPQVSIFNFHYSIPPDSVGQNYDLKRAIADDETGFKGQGDDYYRGEGWSFILAGGAIYDNLDYSFSVSKPDGTLKVTTSPGGGGVELRAQLKLLKDFIEGFDFVRMKPDNTLIKSGLPPKVSARVLSEPGKAYAIYLSGDGVTEIELALPPGKYELRWFDTRHGPLGEPIAIEAASEPVKQKVPTYSHDIALSIKAR